MPSDAFLCVGVMLSKEGRKPGNPGQPVCWSDNHGQGCVPSLGSSSLVEIEMLPWGEAGLHQAQL